MIDKISYGHLLLREENMIDKISYGHLLLREENMIEKMFSSLNNRWP
jgi:hypothetical protein